jgi:hypothetical protein
MKINDEECIAKKNDDSFNVLYHDCDIVIRDAHIR